jgi:hypothetical protein
MNDDKTTHISDSRRPGADGSDTSPGDIPRQGISRRAILQTSGVAGVLTAAGLLQKTAASAATAPSAGAATAGSDRAMTTSKVPSVFGNFVGVCQASAGDMPNVAALAGMAWNRTDFDWGTLEPVQGDFVETAVQNLQALVVAGNQAGVHTLPILDYTAGWAASTAAFSFDEDGQHYSYGPPISQDASSVTRNLTVTGAGGKVISNETVTVGKSSLPPADPATWLSYVERVVKIFTAAPYNIEYFQIWNEAHLGSGFWNAGLDDYMQKIHIPAAKAIRAAGAKVVYGGYPDGLSLSALTTLLDKYRAWDTLDVLDVHYDPLMAMDYLNTAAKKRGKRSISVWQTELGFSPDANFIPNLYPKAFAWALRNDLAAAPDFAKLFWFAWWAPDDPAAYGYDNSLHSGDNLSPHGTALSTLGTLLGGNRVTTFSRFSTTPELGTSLDERASAAEGFTVGDTTVIAVHLARQSQSNVLWDFNGDATAFALTNWNDQLTLTLRGISARAAVSRVDIFGNKVPLQWSSSSRGQVTVSVPVQDTVTDVSAITGNAEVRTFYIVIEN